MVRAGDPVAETMAVARSETSLKANPVDVHRATDAVLTAIDSLATTAPNAVFVVTANGVIHDIDSVIMPKL